jgi:hypothetical protein
MPPKKNEEKIIDVKSPIDNELIKERNRINSVRISLEVKTDFWSIKGLEKALKESIIGKRHATNPLSLFSEEVNLMADDLSDRAFVNSSTAELQKFKLEQRNALEKKVSW